MSLTKYVERIAKIAQNAKSESKLEGEFNQILKECLAEYDIKFDPHVNETLKSMGLSQVDADRPDGVFGHIVYDYKVPGTLSSAKGLHDSKEQLERYLDHITGGHDTSPNVCSDWFGYVTDGITLVYCKSNKRFWQWSRTFSITENTLSLLVHVFRSLQRKPLTSPLLSNAFGKKSEVAYTLIKVMCSHLANPKRKTDMLFREWKRLFEQVSTYDLSQLPSLKKWAVENEIKTRDASIILFAIHSYYSLVVKLVTTELLSVTVSSDSSICEKISATSSVEELIVVMNGIENGDYYRRFRISNFLRAIFLVGMLMKFHLLWQMRFAMLQESFLNLNPQALFLCQKPNRIY